MRSCAWRVDASVVRGIDAASAVERAGALRHAALLRDADSTAARYTDMLLLQHCRCLRRLHAMLRYGAIKAICRDVAAVDSARHGEERLRLMFTIRCATIRAACFAPRAYAAARQRIDSDATSSDARAAPRLTPAGAISHNRRTVTGARDVDKRAMLRRLRAMIEIGCSCLPEAARHGMRCYGCRVIAATRAPQRYKTTCKRCYERLRHCLRAQDAMSARLSRR